MRINDFTPDRIGRVEEVYDSSRAVCPSQIFNVITILPLPKICDVHKSLSQVEPITRINDFTPDRIGRVEEVYGSSRADHSN
ncbi:hypothetical protein M0R45_036687 [Rubus argutus]|uniref:Uncharacterized protein n=1 Tax=Rubus argutus TaxID=59490 RepID=A0AAW1W2A2_RUBAR